MDVYPHICKFPDYSRAQDIGSWGEAVRKRKRDWSTCMTTTGWIHMQTEFYYFFPVQIWMNPTVRIVRHVGHLCIHIYVIKFDIQDLENLLYFTKIGYFRHS